MVQRGRILKGAGIFVVALFCGGVIWFGIGRSGIQAWEFSVEENSLGKDNIQIETEEASVVSGYQDFKSDSFHSAKEETLAQSSEIVTVPSVRREMSVEVHSQSDMNSQSFQLQQKPVSFGFEKAQRKSQDIDTIVLHSSFNNQGGDRYLVDKVIGIWKNYGVAPHFLIDRKGNVYRLVDERHIAYHAGVSEMKDGRRNVNDFSLGVEILNAEDDEYTEAQYRAIRNLVAYLKETYLIKYVVGHDDIAPGRKTDPWNFDWKRIR